MKNEKMRKEVKVIEVARDGSKLAMFGSIGTGVAAAGLHTAGVLADSLALTLLKGSAIGTAVSCGLNIVTSVLWNIKADAMFKAELDEEINNFFDEDTQPQEASQQQDQHQEEPEDSEDPQPEERTE